MACRARLHYRLETGRGRSPNFAWSASWHSMKGPAVLLLVGQLRDLLVLELAREVVVLVLALVQHGQVQVKVERDCQRQEESVQHGHEPGHDQRQRQCRLRR